MATKIIVTAPNKEGEEAISKALEYMVNNLSVLEITRLEIMARSKKAKDLLNNNWGFLKGFI